MNQNFWIRPVTQAVIPAGLLTFVNLTHVDNCSVEDPLDWHLAPVPGYSGVSFEFCFSASLSGIAVQSQRGANR